MARATNKLDLIQAAQNNYNHLLKEIDSFSAYEVAVEFDFSAYPKLMQAHWSRDKNIRDVLIHLFEWHQLLLKWIKSNVAGDFKPFLPEPYNWGNYGGMNMQFLFNHQSTSLKESLLMLEKSHNAVLVLIDKFSDEQLFVKKYFVWTGSTNLASYCISATASHYDWAIKKLKKHKRICSKNNPDNFCKK